jgi:hypothetical protein
MLTECLRKIWTIIPLRKIQRIWEQSGVLAGEQHGFRKSENIQRALEVELAFYGAVLGFSPV